MKSTTKRVRRSARRAAAQGAAGDAAAHAESHAVADTPVSVPLATPIADVPTATALRLYVTLMRAANAVNRHAEANIASHGMSSGEFAILEALYHKGPMLLGDVQRRILASSGGITFLVDRLTRRGLVKRLPCPSDRRARFAALTPKGKVLMDRIFPPHAEAIRRAVSGLGLPDQRAASALLKVLGTEAAALPASALDAG